MLLKATTKARRHEESQRAFRVFVSSWLHFYVSSKSSAFKRRIFSRAASNGPEAGFTLVEMIVATAIMMTVTATVFTVLNPAQGIFLAQPEMSDMQQRLRVGVDALTHDLVMAGAGAYSGSQSGSLAGFFAPIVPSRHG